MSAPERRSFKHEGRTVYEWDQSLRCGSPQHGAACQGCCAPRRPPPAAARELTAPTCCSEVNIYIEAPPGVGAKQFEISITTGHLRVGIQGLPPYLDVRAAAAAVKPAAAQPAC